MSVGSYGKVALLGLSQAGKRTLFSLLTGRNVPENRKESESIEGQASVRDPRVDAIAGIIKPKKIRYAQTNFVLCPDIMEGSDKRYWFEPARQCDLLCIVVRAFSSESVYHPSGSVDADRDRANLETEFLLADLELIETRLGRINKDKREGQTPAQALEEKTLLKCRDAIEAEKKLSLLELEPHELDSIKSLGFLSLMPVLWTYNVDEKDLRREDAVPSCNLQSEIKNQKSKIPDSLTISCLIEREIMDIKDADERKEYLKEMGLGHSGLERMIKAVHDALGLISFYTIARDEVSAWTVPEHTLAPAAAGKVHSDMERGFIRVEIIKYDDLIMKGSEAAVKEQGKVQLKGKDYAIEDGDICFFRFSV